MKTKLVLALVLLFLVAPGGIRSAAASAAVSSQYQTMSRDGNASAAHSSRNNFTLSGFSGTVSNAPEYQNGPSGYKSVHNPNHSIVNTVMTTGVRGDRNEPVDNVSDFDPNIETLYAVVSTRDTAPGTLISLRWIAVNVPGTTRDSVIDSSQISVEGNVNIAFSLKRDADQPWTSGAYRIEVLEDGEPDGTLDFTIGASAKTTPAPPGSGPRIARVITYAASDSAGNPVDVKGEFPAGTKRFGAQVFVNSAAPIEVRAAWWTGIVPGWPSDTKLFEAVGHGSNQQNGILFDIERTGGEPFPPGTYKLELYVDDKLENTTEFQVATSGASPTQPGGTMQISYQGKLDVNPAWRVPAALALAPNGDLYAAESGRVRRVKQDLSSTSFGEMGISQGDGKLGPLVSGIAADSLSNIWVANPQHSNIQKFSPDGKFLFRFPGDDSQTYDKDGEVNQAYGIAVDKQDNIYVADTLNNRIQKFNPNGKFLGKWTNLGLKAPIGIATDAQGNVYVSDTGNHRVLKLDAQGRVVMQFGKQGAGDGEFNGPWGLALDSANNIYVTDNLNQRVQVFDAQGKFLTKFGSSGPDDGQFDKPVGILVAPGGNIYVADGGRSTVQIFAPAPSGANAPAPNSSGGSASGAGRMVADLGFRPNQDGFGFENYGGEYPREQSDLYVEDLIRMFGEQAVCAGYQNGECQVAPGALEWADRANQASNSGHCEGLAVLSLRMFMGKESARQFGDTRAFALKFNNQDLQRAIMYYFAMQTADPVWSAKNAGVAGTPSQVLDDIIAGIQQRDPPVIAIRHYLPNGDREGHAVAPYAVEDRGSGLYYVWIYDNNYPGQERYIEVDRNANTWKYAMAAVNPNEDPDPWSGGAADHTFGAARLSVRDRQAVCEWCNQSDSMTQLTLLGGGDMRVTNSQGQVIGFVDGKFVNEIPGAQPFFVDGGLGKPSVPIYLIPAADTYDMVLDGSNLNATTDSQLFVFGGGKSLNIDNITLARGESNALTLDGNLDTVRYDPESAEDSSITLTVDGAEDDYYFAFGDLNIDAGESLTFTFDETDGTLALDSDNGAADDTFDLTLKRVGDNGTHIYENSDIDFGDEDTEYLDYGGWDGEENLGIGVDQNDDGAVDQQLHEVNER